MVSLPSAFVGLYLRMSHREDALAGCGVQAPGRARRRCAGVSRVWRDYATSLIRSLAKADNWRRRHNPRNSGHSRMFRLLRNRFAHNDIHPDLSDLDTAIANVNMCLRVVGDFREKRTELGPLSTVCRHGITSRRLMPLTLGCRDMRRRVNVVQGVQFGGIGGARNRRRHFCPSCGYGGFLRGEVQPGGSAFAACCGLWASCSSG
jgi:hypothetical protein